MNDNQFQAGTVLKVWLNYYWHKGILLPDGRVLHASKRTGRVTVDSQAEFSDGHIIHAEGYPGNLLPEEIAHRAYRLIGQPYNLFSDNCEHLVTKVHGLPKQSLQLQQWGAVAVVAILAFVVLNKGRVT